MLTYLFGKQFSHVKNGARVLQFYLKVIIGLCVLLMMSSVINMYMISTVHDVAKQMCGNQPAQSHPVARAQKRYARWHSMNV